MAITPKKKIQNPLSSPGGGTGRGSSGGGGVRGAAGRAINKVANKAAEKDAIIRLANTKPVAKATKVVNKIATRNMVANNKKAVNAVADAQVKYKTAEIAKNKALKAANKGKKK